MPAGYTTVTVVAGDRQVDVALPEHAPITDLMGQLLDVCEVPADTAEPGGWRLSPVGAGPLPPDHSLAAAGVVDGQLLVLTPVDVAPPPPFVDDVLDLVAGSADTLGGYWSPRTTTTTLGTVTVALSALALLLPVRRDPDRLLDGVAAAVALLLLGAAIWAARVDRRPAGLLLGAAALAAAGAAGGWAGVGADPGGTLAAAAGAAVAVTIVGALAAPPLASVATLTAAAAMPAGLSGAALLAGATGGQVAAVGGLVATLAIGWLPGVLVTAAGLSGAATRQRPTAAPEPLDFDARTRQVNDLLAYGLAGLGLYLLVAGVTAAVWPGTVWYPGYAALLGALLLLRSRAFSRIAHRAPLHVAGAGTVLAAALALGAPYGLPAQVGTVTALVLAAATGAVTALVSGSRFLSAQLRLAFTVVEFLLTAALIPVLLTALGWFAWLVRML
jgi:type VII secretion integral membrane protein EccD